MARTVRVHGGADTLRVPTIGGVSDPDTRLDPAVQEATGARAAVHAAYRVAARFVERLPARAAFDAATELGELLRDLAEHAAGLRARMAARLAREQGLTVRALARELGLEKTKAGELLARAEREDAAGPDPDASGDEAGG
jgi:hypothetical protein